MNKNTLKNETWVWAIIQNPEKNESFLGQYDETNNIRFIPAFYSKDASVRCINQLKKDESLVYESQAILYEDLVNYTKQNGFLIFFLDDKGKILDKIAPLE
ncbi:MAG: hypothetical protein KKD44_18990 [Proteobacteria bacterium]|nr:hypothetical protein [Pseudomonadota bacterium]